MWSGRKSHGGSKNCCVFGGGGGGGVSFALEVVLKGGAQEDALCSRSRGI